MRRESLGRRSAADGESPAAERRLFAGYETRPAFYDEMFEATGLPRAHCRELCEALDGMPPAEIAAMQAHAERSFLREGITFAVYGEEGAQERIIPIDFLPRLLDAADWDLVERGLKQRLTALNRFLADVYGPARILADGVVPVDLVRGCPQYRVEMQGLEVPHGIHVALCGTDIVRTNEGFVVLEDNLRVPSGVSYMLANRRATEDQPAQPVPPPPRARDRAYPGDRLRRLPGLHPRADRHRARAGRPEPLRLGLPAPRGGAGRADAGRREPRLGRVPAPRPRLDRHRPDQRHDRRPPPRPRRRGPRLRRRSADQGGRLRRRGVPARRAGDGGRGR